MSDPYDVASRYVSLLGSDLEGALSLLDDEARITMPGGERFDRSSLRELLNSGASLFKGKMTLTAKSAIASGARVAIEAEGHVELVNGGVYENRYAFLFEVRDGKIVSVNEYFDTAKVARIFQPQA